MQQGRGAEGHRGARPREFALGQPVQLRIEGAEERIGGSRVALVGGAN